MCAPPALRRKETQQHELPSLRREPIKVPPRQIQRNDARPLTNNALHLHPVTKCREQWATQSLGKKQQADNDVEGDPEPAR